MAEHRRGRLDRLVSPKRVFGALAALVILVLVLVPWPAGGGAARNFSSYEASPAGARGLHDVLERLGFTVERRLRPMRNELGTDAVYVVLEPAVQLTAGEIHLLLEAVRSGAGLLVATMSRPGLADSLGLAPAAVFVAREAGDRRGVLDAMDPGRIAHVLRPASGSRDTASVYAPADATIFASVDTERGREPAVAGLPLGRGSVVVAADTRLFANSAVRQGDAAVRAVRLFEWLLDEDRSRPLVFDEYHHGFGTHADIPAATVRALAHTSPGRALLVLAAAGLALLVAIAVRPIRPLQRERVQRRSPLEHVDALARAYEAVPATARVARLLVRGVHRRHGGVRASFDDASFLRAIAARAPHVAPDVDRLLIAMDERSPSAPADGLAAAILRIENAIRS